jgi:hypothetical protein
MRQYGCIPNAGLFASSSNINSCRRSAEVSIKMVTAMTL